MKGGISMQRNIFILIAVTIWQELVMKNWHNCINGSKQYFYTSCVSQRGIQKVLAKNKFYLLKLKMGHQLFDYDQTESQIL